MDYIYILIGLALGYLGLKHFGAKSDQGEAVRRADAKLADEENKLDGEIDALKDRIDNTKDDRDDKESYWDNN